MEKQLVQIPSPVLQSSQPQSQPKHASHQNRVPLVDRLTVVEMVYHRSAEGGEPKTVESRYTRRLSTREQPYERRTKISGGLWQPIDQGWIINIGLLVLANNEGKFTHSQPSKAEEVKEKGKTLELGIGTDTPKHTSNTDPDNTVVPIAKLRAGESLRFEPIPGTTYYLRTLSNDDIRYTITLMPS